MLKKIMKIAMMGTLVCCWTSSTYAMELKNNISASGFFGQYSVDNVQKRDSDGSTVTGETTKSTQFDNIYSAELKSEISEGKMSAGVVLGADTSDKGQVLVMSIDSTDYAISEAGTQAPVYPEAWVKYQATDSMSLMIGSKLEAPGLAGFTATSGLGSELTFSKAITHGLAAYTDSPGLQLEYKLHEYMGVYFDIYSKNPLATDAVQTTYGYDFAKAQFKNGVAVAGGDYSNDGCVTCLPQYVLLDSYGGSMETGNGMSISLQGALAENIFVGAGYITGTTDQYDDGPADSGSAMQVSLFYGITDSMSITADYGTRSVTMFNGHKQLISGKSIDGKVDLTSTGLAFEIGAGPGKVALYYHTSDAKVEFLGTEYEALSNNQTETTLKYDIDLCEKERCGASFFYLNNVKTPVASGSDATTQSFLGAKLFAKY